MIYAVSPFITGQKELVDKYCFGSCGKISIGGIDMGEWGAFLPCTHEQCPHEEKRSRVLGQALGDDVCVRKLK